MNSRQKSSPFIMESMIDGVAWIVFNRPEQRNAISLEMWEEIPRALTRSRTAGARVVVFRGEGGAFASGADLAELAKLKTPEDARRLWTSIRSALNAVATFELPTIAMISGPCMGGGCLLASSCDFRFADPSARFCVPVAQLGITLDEDSIARLMTLVGRGVASEMLLTSAILTADRAEKVGLINLLVTADNLPNTVFFTCEQIKRNSAEAVGYLKRSIARIAARGSRTEDQTAIVNSYLSEDFRARVAQALGLKRD